MSVREKVKRFWIISIVGWFLYMIGDFLFAATGKGQTGADVADPVLYTCTTSMLIAFILYSAGLQSTCRGWNVIGSSFRNASSSESLPRCAVCS
jgi:hypothetical protein